MEVGKELVLKKMICMVYSYIMTGQMVLYFP